MTDYPNSPVAGNTFTANGIDYVYNGTKWNIFYKKYSYTGAELSNISNITEIDLSIGNLFESTLLSPTTIQFANPPASGLAQKFYLKLSINSNIVLSAYDIANASYDNVSFSVGAQEANPNNVSFKPDGTKMYTIGRGSNAVNEYDLSVAWDISSAVYLQLFSVNAQEGNSQGMFFKPDGTKMYVTGSFGREVNEYDLSVAWDISSAVYLQDFSVFAQATSPVDIFFKPDGTKMYITGYSSDSIHEYDLSVAWDVSSAVFLQTFSYAAQDNTPRSTFFKPDGTKMFMIGTATDSVHEYDLSVAWDISSASLLQNFSIGAQETVPRAVSFKTDGTKMYMLGSTTDTVYQYSTGSSSNLLITWPTSIIWETGSPPNVLEGSETLLLELYTSDNGTTYYANYQEIT